MERMPHSVIGFGGAVVLVGVLVFGQAVGAQAGAQVGAGVGSAQGEWERVGERAIEQIKVSAGGQDPFLRANAIEASQADRATARELVGAGLSDRFAVVRFSALVTVGVLRLDEFVPSASDALTDPTESVRGAAMFALRRCGRAVDVSPLAGMLTSRDPGVRGNAALLLGRIGDPSAVAMLKELAQVPMPRVSAAREAIVRIQIAEAIANLGGDTALAALRAGAYSQFDEVRVLAVLMMGRVGDRRMEKGIESFLREPPIELQLAAAESLARFGRSDGRAVVVNACQSPIATVRAQAASALALFDQPIARRALAGLLEDSSEQVRLAAAAGILAISGR